MYYTFNAKNHGRNWLRQLIITLAGAFVFGNGLAIVPFLHAGVVKENNWLTEQQFVDSFAVAMITPGPVVITVGFICCLIAGFPGVLVGAVIVIASRSILDIPTALIAIVTIFALLYIKKIQEPYIIVVAAVLGVIIKYIV